MANADLFHNVSGMILELDNPFFELKNRNNYYDPPILGSLFDIWSTVHIFIKQALGIVSSLASVFLIISLIKFPQFRQGHQIYLLHFSIINFCYVVFLPFFDLLLDMVLHYNIRYCLMCSIYSISVVDLMSLWFLLLVILDWYLVKIQSGITRYYEWFQRIALILIYSLASIQYGLVVYYCFHYEFVLPYIANFAYLSSLIGTIILRFLIKSKGLDDDTNPIRLCLILQLTWLPAVILSIIWRLLIEIVTYVDGLFLFIHMLSCICEYLVLLIPVINLYILSKHHPEFQQQLQKYINIRKAAGLDKDDENDVAGNEYDYNSDRIPIL